MKERKRSAFIVLFSVCLIFLASTQSFAQDEANKDAAAPATAPAPLEPGSDFVCEAQVTYNWRKRTPVLPKGSKEPAPTPYDPIKVFFATVGERGTIEADVKERVTGILEKTKEEAQIDCKSVHENQTGCVSRKMRENSDGYSRMDFSARRSFLDAVKSDCEEAFGNCLNSEASAVLCRVRKPSDIAPKPPEAAKDTAKDKGKKK